MISKDLQNKIEQCETFQQELWSYRPLSPETLMSLKEYYRIGTTYSSNAIEGNSLTESETKVIIENGLTIEGKPLRDIYEAVGHAKAYDYLYELNREEPITEEIICNIHRLFYQQIDADKAGNFRKVPVFISGSRYAVAPVSEISKRMRQLVQWYNNNENKLHPVILAAEFHKRFVFIHPFIDGNGRVARLLMNLSLMRNDYNIAIIPAVTRAEYIEVLEKRQGLKVACLEGIAYRQGWISEERMRELAQPMIKNQYGQYLLKVIDELKETGKPNLE